jgi:hypothetical protein
MVDAVRCSTAWPRAAAPRGCILPGCCLAAGCCIMNRIAAAGQSPRSLKLEISSLRQPPLNRRSRQEKIPVGYRYQPSSQAYHHRQAGGAAAGSVNLEADLEGYRDCDWGLP